ncbi:zinc finger protein-domain-containing protein [Nemania abortiva]|nr:zinc finger protein-domain-containing protein [Nemania abortiva]
MANNGAVIPTPLHRIGVGSCGSVWSDISPRPGGVAMKCGEGGSLKYDSDMHQRILEAYKSGKARRFAMPIWLGYISADTAKKFADEFPRGWPQGSILLTERILPLPKTTSHFLTEKYCPRRLISSIATDSSNHVCLVRPYLGGRRGSYRDSTSHGFSLCDFPLYLDQMEELGLEIHIYASRMAKALAFMHWSAQVDANGVDFVLAPAPKAPLMMRSPVLGKHCLWMLDFDRCRPMTMDDAGLEKATRAFWENNRYYPRPVKGVGEDSLLWHHFKHCYLEESSYIVGLGDVRQHGLPRNFIAMIEAELPVQN